MSFESVFFGPGNQLEWQRIVNREMPESALSKLTPFIESVKAADEAAVLPRALQDGSVVWYILPPSARIARFSREEIRGFLGASYSLNDTFHSRLDPSDAIDSAVLQKYGANAFKIYVPQMLRERARERLLTYVRLRSARPSRLRNYIRSSGRVLRDFEYAILAGSFEEATERIDELRSAGHLDATNLLFLRVRALAAVHRWSEIYSLPEMDSLLNIQRPIRVTECLIRAVYATQLQAFEGQVSPKQARDRFSQIYDTFQDLYKTRSTLKGDEIESSFMLAALVAEPVRFEVARAIINSVDLETPHGRYLSALSALLPSQVQAVVDPLTEGRQAFANGDIDKAIEQCILAPPSRDKVILLLRCAWEAGTLSAAAIALEALHLLNVVDSAALRSNGQTGKLISSLTALTSPVAQDTDCDSLEIEALSGWLPWLQRLRHSKAWDRALAVAESGSREWDQSKLSGNLVEVGLINDALLDDKAEWAKPVFRNALPFLVDFFTLNGYDVRFQIIYETLFFLIAMDEEMSVSQIQVLTRLGDVRISLGLSPSRYEEVVGQMRDAIRQMDSPAVIDSYLDVCESLIMFPCPDPNARVQFFVFASASFTRWHRRLAPSQIALFRSLGEDLGQDLVIPEISEKSATDHGESGFAVALADRRLGIYSLQEGAAKRAAILLQQLVRNIRVEVFSDHAGGSGALKNAAQQFDYFVIVTAAAKHAATIFIERHRSKDKPTLYANGQGSSSIFQTLSAYFEGSPS